jgi:hypothetical protein
LTHKQCLEYGLVTEIIWPIYLDHGLFMLWMT